MINRKQIELDRFKKEINKVWSLSVIEDKVLTSFFNLFLAGENKKIKQIEHLLDDEVYELLESLNERLIINFAVDDLDLIEKEDESGLEDALDDLDFKWISKVNCNDMVKYLKIEGYSVEEESKEVYNIVTNMQLEEMTELFLSADNNKREEVINKLK